MSDLPRRPSRQSSSFRFSRDNKGFQQITGSPGMAPNDVKVDIPLDDMSPQSRSEKTESLYGIDASGAPVAGRRKKLNRSDSDFGLDTEEPRVNRIGQFYQKVMDFSIITRYLIYVLPAALVIGIPIIIGATVAPNALIAGVSMTWFFVWIEVVWLSLWVSKIVAHFLPRIFQALVGVVSSGTRKYALIITNLGIPLSLVGWTVTSLATFVPVMVQNPEAKRRATKQLQSGLPVTATAVSSWMSVVRQVLAACLISALVLLAERILIQLISINYHKRQMNMRVKVSKREVHLISLMYEASQVLFPLDCPEFREEDAVIGGYSDFPSFKKKKSRAHVRSGSSTPMKLFQEVGRIGDKLTSAFGNVASEITGKQLNSNSMHSLVVVALEKQPSSEALARRIWMSFVVEGREALTREDFTEVMGASRVTEAEECFAALDQDGNGDVSLDEMVNTVVQIGQERKSIANSLHDVGQAIAALDSLLCTVVFIMTIFIFVALLNQSFATTLATAGTALLSLSFVFATTCQEVLGSCIFLFVKHPYDVGDRVEITKEGLLVERISLLYTEFKRVTNSTSVQIPNSILNTLWIENISRSKPQNESITLSVAFDTSFRDIETLKEEMEKFVSDQEHSRDFLPGIDTELTNVEDMSKLTLRVGFKYKSNWANGGLKMVRRNKFMCALIETLRRVPVYGPGGGGPGLGEIGNPSYSVAISPSEAEQRKTESSDALDAKRMYPSKTEDGSDSTSSDEPVLVGGQQNLTGYSSAVAPTGLAIHRAVSVLRNSSLSVENHRNSELLRRKSTGIRRQSAALSQTSSWRGSIAPSITTHPPAQDSHGQPYPSVNPTGPVAGNAFAARNQANLRF